jgi:hypothetical protein
MPQVDIQLDSIDVARGRLADEVQKLESQGAQIQEIRYPGWATAALGIKRDASVGNAGTYRGHRAVQYTEPYPGRTVTVTWEA